MLAEISCNLDGKKTMQLSRTLLNINMVYSY